MSHDTEAASATTTTAAAPPPPPSSSSLHALPVWLDRVIVMSRLLQWFDAVAGSHATAAPADFTSGSTFYGPPLPLDIGDSVWDGRDALLRPLPAVAITVPAAATTAVDGSSSGGGKMVTSPTSSPTSLLRASVSSSGVAAGSGTAGAGSSAALPVTPLSSGTASGGTSPATAAIAGLVRRSGGSTGRDIVPQLCVLQGKWRPAQDHQLVEWIQAEFDSAVAAGRKADGSSGGGGAGGAPAVSPTSTSPYRRSPSSNTLQSATALREEVRVGRAAAVATLVWCSVGCLLMRMRWSVPQGVVH